MIREGGDSILVGHKGIQVGEGGNDAADQWGTVADLAAQDCFANGGAEGKLGD